MAGTDVGCRESNDTCPSEREGDNPNCLSNIGRVTILIALVQGYIFFKNAGVGGE